MSTCNITPEEPPKPNIVGSAIAARVRKFYADLADRAGVITQSQEIEMTLAREYNVIASAAAHLPNITRYSRLENFVAKVLGIKSWLWQAASETMTEAGAMRYFAMDKAHTTSNLISYAALYRALPEIQRLYNTLKSSLPTLDAATLQEAIYDTIAIGQFPKLANIMDSPVVRYSLETRFNEYQQRMIALGLNPAQRAEIEQLAGSITSHLDILRSIAAKEGLDIPVLRNGGYFPLRATEEAARFMNTEAWLVSKGNQTFDTAEILKRSRNTNVALVMDVKEMANMMNMSEFVLVDWMSRPGDLSKLMRSQLGEYDFNKAIANDWLVQAPALSDELTEFFNESFDLPTRNLAEAIILDPVTAVTKYAEELEKAVKASGLVKELLTTGIERGLVLSKTEVDSLPNALDYVLIGSNKSMQDLIRSDNIRDTVAELYVHRTVAEQMEAVIKLNSSWSDLGTAARTWQSFTGIFRKSAILGAGFGYLQRVFGQNTISLYTATGNLGQMGYGAADVARIAAAKSFDVLDNSRTFATINGRDYTLRDLFLAYFAKRGSLFVSGAQENLDLSSQVFKSPKELFQNFAPSIERHIRLTYAYHEMNSTNLFTGKALATSELVGKGANWLLDSSYKNLAGMNVMMDMSARWAAIRTLATDGKRNWQNLDELIRYTDEYFNIQEDAGSFGKAYGSIGQPFAAFAFNAPGSALRHAIRKPWQAGRIGILYSRYGTNTELSDEEMAQWQKDSYAITMYTDPNTGNKYAVFPGTVDFYLDTATQAREFAEDLGRAFGADVGSAKEIYEQQRDPAKPIMEFLQAVVSDTYFNDVLNGIREVDSRTGQEYKGENSTLLGIPMKRSLREVLIGALPVLRTLDTTLPMSGTRPVKDTITEMPIDPGQPGWLGVTPPENAGRRPPNVALEQSPVAWLAQYGLGLSVQEISPTKNLISNYKDFSNMDTELTKAINDAEDKIRLQPDPKLRDGLITEMQHMQRLRIWLGFQKWKIDQYAKDYGIPSIKAVEKWRQGFDIERNLQQDMILFLQEQQQNYGN